MDSGWLHRFGGLIALAAGLSLPLAFSPFDFYFIAPLSLVLLFLVWDCASPRRAAWLGFVYGLGLFGFGTHWLYVSLHVFGKTPLMLALLLMAALMAFMASYTAAVGYMVSRWIPSGPWRWLVALPATWVCSEWLRGWVLSGFPWLSVGYTATDSALAGWIPLGGVYAATFMVAVSAGGMLALFKGNKRTRIAAIVVVLACWAGGTLLKQVNWTHAAGEALQVSIVQGAVPQDRKWLPEELVPTMQLYRRLTEQHWDSDIVIWPEAAIPALRSSLDDYLRMMSRQAEKTNTALLMGIVEHRPETGQFYNGVLALDERAMFYYKRHLVPFGEYFPVPSFVRSWMRLQNLPYNDYTAGADNQPALDVAGAKVGASICYEDVFGDEMRAALPEATLLVNVSNDAWFGESIAPHQHLQIARARAIEAGRYLLRSTNTGITAVIAPWGQIGQKIPQFETGVLTAQVWPYQGSTPYVVVGDRAVVIIAVLMLLACVLVQRTGRTAIVTKS